MQPPFNQPLLCQRMVDDACEGLFVLQCAIDYVWNCHHIWLRLIAWLPALEYKNLATSGESNTCNYM